MTIWDYAMTCRHNGHDLRSEDGQDQIVHYIQVSGSGYTPQEVSVAAISMSLFFPRNHPLTIDVVEHKTRSDLGILFDQLNSTEIRKDLELMWNRNMFSDILVALPYGEDTTQSKKDDVFLFPSHKFMLRGRSSFFRDILSCAEVQKSQQPSTLTATDTVPIVFLPRSSIKPSIWEFVFRFIYTGTLEFRYSTQNFSSDLATATSIYRVSVTIDLQSLKNLISHTIVDMLHGLYHAPMATVSDEELSSLRCKCLRCAHHVPFVFGLSLEPGFENPIFERGARRALFGLFGPGWCTDEFSALPYFLQLSILEELRHRTTTRNVFFMMFVANRAALAVGFNVHSHSWLMSMALSHIESVLSRDPGA